MSWRTPVIFLSVLLIAGCSDENPTGTTTFGRLSTRFDEPEIHLIDFEHLPSNGSSCADTHDPWEEEWIPNPLEIDGVVFTAPRCLGTGFCSWPTCSRDPDNPEGNIVLFLNVGSTIVFPEETEGVVLVVQGIGDHPFSVEVSTLDGGSELIERRGIPFGVLNVGINSDEGIQKIEVISTGPTDGCSSTICGPLVLSDVFYSDDEIELEEDDEDPAQLLPEACGTVRLMPELDVFGIAPVGGAIQSKYFRTTDVNREIRRGMFEFQIPDYEEEIAGATLLLSESGGWTSHPMPPDEHSLSFYEADGVITVEDFDRPSTLIRTLVTDPNEDNGRWSIEITDIVTQYVGGKLGFRIQLLNDLDIDIEDGWAGTGFGSNSALPPELHIVFEDDDKP